MLLNVCVLSPKGVIFQGTARSAVLPGEEGVFEVLPFHKSIVSRLISGNLFIDNEAIPIARGAMKLDKNELTVVVEEP